MRQFGGVVILTLKNIETVVALVFVAGIFQPAVADSVKPLPSKLLERGRYLVKITGCNDCHTPGYAATGGQIPELKWLVGDQLGWRGPWGTTYPSNLRLFMSKITEDQWVKTARTTTYRPPMPWFALREMSRADLKAMYRYIKHLGSAGDPAPAYVPSDQEPQGPVVMFPLQPK